MAFHKGSSNIVSTFRLLKGNVRTSVLCEPMYGIPFALYNFYLSLYMKSLGITDAQIGFLIAVNAFFSAGCAFVAGVITDHLGRKKTTLIFDMISLPFPLLLYASAHSFWPFAVGMILNSCNKIVNISWNLMVVEDADSAQRISAFNLLYIINLATGVLTPLAGIAIALFGIIPAERGFLIFAACSMVTLDLVRNHFYVETRVGREILSSNPKFHMRELLKSSLYKRASAAIFKSRGTLMILSVYVLFNIYIPLGTFSSLYYAPFLNEALGIGKSAISILGAVNSLVMLAVFVFVIPAISRLNIIGNMLAGAVIQLISLVWFIALPRNNLTAAVFCVIFFAVGFSVFRPFIDTALADVTDGRERAGIYSLLNAAVCLVSALVGLFSGYMFQFNPRLIYMVSAVILLSCAVILILFYKNHRLQPAGSAD